MDPRSRDRATPDIASALLERLMPGIGPERRQVDQWATRGHEMATTVADREVRGRTHPFPALRCPSQHRTRGTRKAEAGRVSPHTP
jgi:hypothetical protein